MAALHSIIVFHIRHFVRYLGICNRICVKLLQLMSGVTTHNSVKKKRSLHINKWLSYGHIWCFTGAICPPSGNLYLDLYKPLTGYVLCHSEQFKRKTASLSQTVFLRSTNTAYTHKDTHTHTHTHT